LNWRNRIKKSETAIDQIDLGDERFLIPCYLPSESLVKSIESADVINPPLLLDAGGSRLIPVLGRRRIEALKLLRVDSVKAYLVEELSEVEAFRIAFWDNVAHRPPNPAYVGYVVKRLLDLFPMDTVSRDFLPALGVPASGPRIERFRKIGCLDRSILDALGAGRILEKTAALLAELESEDRRALMDLVSALRLNANKATEVIGAVFDLSVYNSAPVRDYLDSPEAQSILTKDSLSAQDKATQLRSLLAGLKHPVTKAKQDEFELWRKSIPTSKRVTIRPHQAFETPGCVMELRAESLEFAEKALDAISALDNNDK
jgi:ParB-like chromosome segregation protein Spo0J